MSTSTTTDSAANNTQRANDGPSAEMKADHHRLADTQRPYGADFGRMRPSAHLGESLRADFLVLGGGIAGASLALKLATRGTVLLATKDTAHESNTRYAQGGIASVLMTGDSFADHIRDTLVAGAGLCHPDVVKKVVEEGPHAIERLIQLGVPFTPSAETGDSFGFHLTREGGHSARRIIHAADLTGAAVQDTLTAALVQNENIQLLEHHMCIDLIVTDKSAPDFSRNRCLGAYLLDEKSQKIHKATAPATFVATGGHGMVYQYTSNPPIATGDGLAACKRAGARVANLEFMQFHPTSLFDRSGRNFLVSEALRGEGGRLFSRDGRRFMEGVHPDLELAPRDVVARAIDNELKKGGEANVFLDISHKGGAFIEAHFPNILSVCLENGIDMRKEPIPVVPAAHYSCGGVVTDARGRTGIKCLWAIGETACTGLHGANRLASNSLLEGLAFAEFAAADVLRNLDHIRSLPMPDVPDWIFGTSWEADEMGVVAHLWDEIRRTMWNYVGIVRTDKRLARAKARILQIMEEIETHYWNFIPNRPLLEVRNLATVAFLTVECARRRKESRGAHFSLDYPQKLPEAETRDTVLV
jgi:L-aspartate oxidase